MIEKHDDKPIRCPRLGDHVNFGYCRIMNDRLPCRWIAGCWQMHMDINRFLGEHYNEEELDRVFAPPKEKVQILVELIEKARQAKEEPA